MSKIIELGPSKIKGSVGDHTFRQTQNGTVVTEKNRVFAVCIVRYPQAEPTPVLRQKKSAVYMALENY